MAQLETKMDRVEAGVANFRSFQSDMRDFVNRYEAREDQKQKDWERRRAEEKSSEQKIDRLMGRLYRTLIIIAAIWAGLQAVSTWAGPEIRKAFGISQIRTLPGRSGREEYGNVGPIPKSKE